jgi:hypothetical protein
MNQMTIQRYLVTADSCQSKAKYFAEQVALYAITSPRNSPNIALWRASANYFKAKAEYLRAKAHYLLVGEKIP